MLHRVIEVQPLPGLWKTVVGQTPNPSRPIRDHQSARRLAQASPHGFGVQLLAQCVNALAGGHKTALADDGPSSGGPPAVIQAKDRAGVDPVPPFRFLSPATPRRALA